MNIKKRFLALQELATYFLLVLVLKVEIILMEFYLVKKNMNKPKYI